MFHTSNIYSSIYLPNLSISREFHISTVYHYLCIKTYLDAELAYTCLSLIVDKYLANSELMCALIQKKSDSLDKENNDSWRMKPRKSV